MKQHSPVYLTWCQRHGFDPSSTDASCAFEDAFYSQENIDTIESLNAELVTIQEKTKSLIALVLAEYCLTEDERRPFFELREALHKSADLVERVKKEYLFSKMEKLNKEN